MKRFILLSFLLFCIVFAALGYGLYYYATPASSSATNNVIIRKGMRSQASAQALAEAGVINHPKIFYAIAVATGQARYFKAGEYEFSAGATPMEVMHKLVGGEVVVHKITIPEGWNIREVRAALEAQPVLEGDLTMELKEGSVLPETYHFTYGDTRNEVAARMKAAMDKALDAAWASRSESLPYANKEELLTLASIVEKETGVDAERARVAGVFINRLRKNMMLQTDPTVAYGIEEKNGMPLQRALIYADLEMPTPYNTYMILGLPPGPIANPGLESLQAAAQPMATDELYFVAVGDGSGAHRFAATLEEHNKNVAAYRAALKAR